MGKCERGWTESAEGARRGWGAYRVALHQHERGEVRGRAALPQLPHVLLDRPELHRRGNVRVRHKVDEAIAQVALLPHAVRQGLLSMGWGAAGGGGCARRRRTARSPSPGAARAPWAPAPPRWPALPPAPPAPAPAAGASTPSPLLSLSPRLPWACRRPTRARWLGAGASAGAYGPSRPPAAPSPSSRRQLHPHTHPSL